MRQGGISLSSSPDCNAAKLRNECSSLFMLAPLYKARADTLPGGEIFFPTTFLSMAQNVNLLTE